MVNVNGKNGARSLIQARNLDKIYTRGEEEIHCLSGLNLDVEKGEFIAFMGPSGSGKTTLLNLLGGLDKPTRGSIVANDIEITSLSENMLAQWRAENVGFVFQMYNLLPVLTAYQNVEIPLLLTSLSKKEREEHIMAALELTNIVDRKDHYPSQLSGGQQQRVSIARAIVSNPLFLLCDEPTGDLDRKSGDEVMTLLKNLSEQLNITVLMVTHDPKAAEAADTILHLEKGVLIEGKTVK
ncbi:MAG: ABC transporter ATP-binding protein [Acidobacteriota bacterium]|nr:ABC transporter ATP-binding protein [Thermoanaerobaculaceae bacterium]